MIRNISLLIATIALLLASCQSGEKKAEAPTGQKKATAKVKSSAPQGKFGDIAPCALLSESALGEVFPSEAGYNKHGDAGENRLSCRISLKDGAGMLTWSVNYNPNGWAGNTERFEKIAGFGKVDVKGADGAVIHAQQNRMEVWKGNYAITITAPITPATANDKEAQTAGGIRVAEEILTKLP